MEESNKKTLAAVAISTMLIAVVLIGAAAGGGYYVYEDVKSADINPTDVFVDASSQDDDDTDPDPQPEPDVTETQIDTDDAMDAILSYFGVDVDDQSLILEAKECIKKLNTKVYKINGMTMEQVCNNYRKKMVIDGYEIIADQSHDGQGFDGALIFAKGTMHGRGIAAASGTAVTTLFDCDVILVTTHSTLTAYYDCQSLINQAESQCCP